MLQYLAHGYLRTLLVASWPNNSALLEVGTIPYPTDLPYHVLIVRCMSTTQNIKFRDKTSSPPQNRLNLRDHGFCRFIPGTFSNNIINPVTQHLLLLS